MDDAAEARTLLSAKAVRERAHEMLALCEAGSLPHWTVNLERLASTADFVLATTRDAYPDLKPPFHSRWRHFKIGCLDLGAPYLRGGLRQDAAERARTAFDLAIVSVLLDAGAGPAWRYRSSSGDLLGRSEGLAVASLDMFEAGLFSGDPSKPRRVDAERLAALRIEDLERGFQASAGNPIAGLDGRLRLLHGLGAAVSARPELFSLEDGSRPGGLFDWLARRADAGALPAPAILQALLDGFGPIWPSRLTLAGVPLGDVWRHPAIRRKDATDGLVPLHKLSQWMAYSLAEPLQAVGIDVVDIDGLTGLAEYRNGGLFIDMGVMRPRDREALTRARPADDPLIVEWRALVVALLDKVAIEVRRSLGLEAAALPLVRVLEGGTWAAGRRIARRLRPNGEPPLAILSDGTVF